MTEWRIRIGTTNMAVSATLSVIMSAKVTLSKSMIKMQAKKKTPSKYSVWKIASDFHELYAFCIVKDTTISWNSSRLENMAAMLLSPLGDMLRQPAMSGARMVCMPIKNLSVKIPVIANVTAPAPVRIYFTFLDRSYIA